MPPLRGGLVVRAAKQAKGGGARPAKPPAAPPAPSWPPAKAEPARRPGQPLLWATALSKSHDGERQQFSGLELALERGSVVAVVGPNGSGKSTLLSCLAGVGEPADEGGVQLRKGSRVAFLPQEPQFAPAATVLDAVLGSATSPAMVAVRAHAAALAAAAAGDASAAGALPDLTAALDAVPGGWTAEADVRAALERLGVAHLAGAAAGTLSGGQRKRAALAAALLSSGSDDVLVLDEPTNHLSVEGVEWLERRLAGPAAPPGQAVVLVTHDRAFMDAVATDVLELDGFGGWHRHPGSYAAFAAGREGRLAAAAAAAANAETLLRTEAAWMARQPQGRQAKQQARVKRFHDLTGAAAAGPQRMGGLDLAGGSVRASRLGGTVLELSGVSLSLGGAPILRDFTYSFERGDRVALVGPNGAGKTTFTRILTGQQGVDAGSVRRGDTLRFGVYEQTAEFARPDQRVADYVAQLAADAREDDPSGGDWNGWSVAQLLDRFQFSRGRQAVPVGRLSGGEKRRLQLLAVLSRRPNFVIMDEPTNDLDVETIEAVEALLAAFDGVVVVTGHDRAFVDAVADHVFVFDGAGGVSDWGGSFSELRAHQQATARAGGGGSGVAAAAAAAAPAAAAARAAAAAEAAGGAPGVVPPTPAERAEQQKARRSADNAAKKMARVEAAIEAADEALAGLDARLCEAGADAGAASVLAAQRAAAAAEQEKLFAELERLDAAARGAG